MSKILYLLQKWSPEGVVSTRLFRSAESAMAAVEGANWNKRPDGVLKGDCYEALVGDHLYEVLPRLVEG